MNNPYEELNFPDNMSYDKRSDLRKECFRFIKFAYYIDFLAVECLNNIFINSIQLFIDEVKELSDPKTKKEIILREIEK